MFFKYLSFCLFQQSRILAAKLLELKYLVKTGDSVLAKGIITDDLIGIIVRRYKLDENKLTLKDFWRCVAKFGGFLGWKGDKEPGWQTL